MFASVSVSAFAACGGPSEGAALSYGESARRDYERAYEAVQDDDCLTATPLLNNVRRQYPYSRYAALAELRIADCEMKQQHYTEAIRAYRAFIRQRPTHQDLDTANYSVADAYFRQIPQDFILSPPSEERDQASTRSALRVVRRFLVDYPESEHLEDARRIERRVLELLARHELYVANYYLYLDQSEAVIGRLQTLLEQYEGSGVEPEALILLGRVHLRMRQEREAGMVFAELTQRYPESGFAVQARNYLAALGIDPGVDTGDESSSIPAPTEDAAELEARRRRAATLAGDSGDDEEDLSPTAPRPRRQQGPGGPPPH